jgi:YidC/Oxa1 family membrane protein insertase
MERRLLVVFALTFLVIMLFQPLMKKYGPQPPAPAKTAGSGGQAGGAAQSAESGTGQSAVTTQASSPQASSAQTSLTQRSMKQASLTQTLAPVVANSETETVIENDLYRIVLTNRGGRVKSWVLKKYTDDKGGPLELVNAAA